MRHKFSPIVVAFFLIFSCSSAKRDFTGEEILINKFGFKITDKTHIIYHTKQDVMAKYQTYPWSDNEREDGIVAQWSTNVDKFIDSAYTLDENGKYHGPCIQFDGDSSGGYSYEYYTHGIKDSVWIRKLANGGSSVERYKNGKMDGIWKKTKNDGTVLFIKKFMMGTIIDTAFNWWPNGKLMEMEVFDKGNSVVHRCYEEDGKTETECE